MTDRRDDRQQPGRRPGETERGGAGGGGLLVDVAVHQLDQEVAALARRQDLLLPAPQQRERDHADRAVNRHAVEVVDRRVECEHGQPAPGLVVAAADRGGECLDRVVEPPVQRLPGRQHGVVRRAVGSVEQHAAADPLEHHRVGDRLRRA